MTLDELLDCNAETLEKMTDTELVKYFSPYFTVTRPELVKKESGGARQYEPLSFKMKQNMAKMAEIGIDVSGLLPKRRKI